MVFLLQIDQLLPRDCLIVTEGSNTMDIARTMIRSFLPRHRSEPFANCGAKWLLFNNKILIEDTLGW